MLLIELVSKWEICWALWSLVLFDSVWRLNLNNIAWFLMGDLLRLSPWSEGLGRQARLAHCGTAFCNQDFLVWCGCCVIYIYIENIVTASCTLYYSLIIVISLQLRGHRQIAEPRKYCLMRDFFFFGVCFLYFFVSHRLGIQLKFPSTIGSCFTFQHSNSKQMRFGGQNSISSRNFSSLPSKLRW